MTAVTTDATLFGLDRRGWRPFGLLLAAMAVVVIAYWQSFAPMTAMWSLTTYQYCWFVFPISLVMLWHIRGRLATLPLRASAAGVAALTGTVAVWVVASAANVQVVEFVAVTSLIPALAWSVGGTRLFRAALFPLLFLVAAVPVGESIVPALMLSTADIASWLLDRVGVPAYREGMFLTLPGGQFEVADVCSGLRYLLTGTVIAVLFAYWNYRSVGKRLLFVTAVAASFIIANGVRAFIVMYVASATDMRVFAGRDHVIFGQLLFLVLAIGLMYLGGRYTDADDADGSTQHARAASIEWRPWLLLLSVIVLLFGPVGQGIRNDGTAAYAALPLPQADIKGCDSDEAWLPAWRPRLSAPDREAAGSWRCGATEISLYQAAYASQEQGKELVSGSNELWPHRWRRYVTSGSRSIKLAAGGQAVREVFHADPRKATLIWYWYEVGGVSSSSTYYIKFIEGLHALRLHEPNAAIVMLIAEGPANRDTLARKLQQAAVDLRQAP